MYTYMRIDIIYIIVHPSPSLFKIVCLICDYIISLHFQQFILYSCLRFRLPTDHFEIST